MKVYKFQEEGRYLLVQFYSEDIVRFLYGQEFKKNISDAVVLEPAGVVTSGYGKKISGPKFDIEIKEKLLVKIIEKDGTAIVEDKAIRFNAEDEDSKRLEGLEDFDGNLGDRKKVKTHGIIVDKLHLWEKGFYGAGEHYTQINLLHNNIENWNTDILGIAPIHNPAQKVFHTSIPFYIGMDKSRAYGIFYDNSYRNSFDFARYSKDITFKADGGELDYYFIYGKKVSDVVERYTLLTGRMPIPRKDFLGYQQCRWSYKNSGEVLALAEKFRELKIPADVIYLDIDYMQNYKVFTINSERFNNFKAMTDRLHSMGFKLVVIIDPGVKVEKGYDVFDSGLEKDAFIKDKNGLIYVGKVWPGASAFPDFLREKIRNWWGELHKGLVCQGVDGIWNDMNEASDMSTTTKTVPEDTYHLDDKGGIHYQKEVHNLYAHHMGKSTYNGLVNIKNERPFVLTRSASAGTQRYSALWTGDNSSVWEHMEASISNLLNLGLSGFSFVGSDIGGFLEDGKPELLARWMQIGAFYPLCRNHSVINSLHQEPWSFDNETLEITKKYIELRYSLLDYIYNLFYESSLKGAPVMRPVFYHYQDDEKTFNITDQFMIGKDFIAAPVLRPKTYVRMVYLPAGGWIDYFTGDRYEGGQYIIKEAGAGELPLFVKEGAIILVNKPMQYVENREKQNYEIHIYGTGNSIREYYFDDGLTFGYVDGKFTKIEVMYDSKSVTVNKIYDNYGIGGIDCIVYRDGRKIKINGIEYGKKYEIQ